jgi:hypothetical protein
MGGFTSLLIAFSFSSHSIIKLVEVFFEIETGVMLPISMLGGGASFNVLVPACC